MSEIKHGTVTVVIDDSIEIPANAGNLSPKEVLEIPKPPRGIGAAASDTAEAARNAGGKFVMPAGVTPDGLEKAGEDAESIDNVIASVEVVLNTLKQANFLLDAKAWEMLRKVNDQVLAQGKTSPEVRSMFKPLTDYMSRFGRSKPRTPVAPS